MTDDEVNHIATELGVVLPSDYRHILTHFPIRFAAGRTTEAIWDNAHEIIKRNQELRRKRRSLGTDYLAIPSNMLFIGDDKAGWQYLLDLSAPEPTPVYVMEYVQRISPASDMLKCSYISDLNPKN